MSHREDASAQESGLGVDPTGLADTSSIQVGVGAQESALPVRPTVVHTSTDEHLRHHRHQRRAAATAAAARTHIYTFICHFV